ncbi:MAG: ATP-binding protein [Opitutaceae bacterium]|jgi:predicted HTH transcriptional regulator
MSTSSKSLIFVSSVQKELAAERRALKEYVHNDPLLSRFFEVFLFEDTPASDRRADQVYLAEVDRCAIYCGLFGNEYGFEDAAGVSPTEQEFDRASVEGKTRLIFVKGTDDKARQPKMRALIRKAGGQLIRRRFGRIPELTAALYASLVEFLDGRGTIQSRPFEDRPAPGATLDDIDAEAVIAFVRRARAERQFPLPVDAPLATVLMHLNLLCDHQPTQAALLLFGRQPQRFTPAAEVRCMHFHGTEIQRPVPYYQIFKGPLFEQVDRATNFALGVLNRGVGTRALSNQAPVTFEIPPDVISEAIVNAIAHRDYTSAAAVQVSVFADRVEIWNPGLLPPPLTPERLRHPHRSIAHNPRIAEALFLTRYIEKFGTGTLMMIRESAAHALPEPDFEQRGGEFVTTVWRDWLTASVLGGLNLNERQLKTLAHLKSAGRITNAEFQKLAGGSRRTALRELSALVEAGILRLVGSGRGSVYVLAGKRAVNAPNAPSDNQVSPKKKRAMNAPNAPGIKPAKNPTNPTPPSSTLRRKGLTKRRRI